MHLQKLCAVVLAYAGTAMADCLLVDTLKEIPTEPEKRTALCRPTAEGRWTVAADYSQTSFPSFNSGAEWAGLVDHKAFILYNEACIPQGVYTLHGNKCGTNFLIQNAALPWTIVIKYIDWDISQLGFAYANGWYYNDWCGQLNGGLQPENACNIDFPIHGEPAKPTSTDSKPKPTYKPPPTPGGGGIGGPGRSQGDPRKRSAREFAA